MIKKLVGVLLFLMGMIGVTACVPLFIRYLQLGIYSNPKPLIGTVVSVSLAVGGVFLFFQKKKSRVDSYLASYDNSFVDDERLREQGRISYVSTSQTYIWKYKGRSSSAQTFRVQQYLIFLCAIIVVPGVLILCQLWIVNSSSDSFVAQNGRSISVIFIFIVSGLLMWGAIQVGIRTQAMLFAFARDESGYLYLFDYKHPAFKQYAGRHMNITGSGATGTAASIISALYNSRQDAKIITHIDQGKIIEQLMSSGQIYSYGEKIIHVSKIRRGISCCRVFCTLQQADEAPHDRSIVIPYTYDHYNELIQALEKLRW